MKLSDIKGERTLDVIADLLDPIYSIAEDPEAAALFQRQKLPDGMTAREFGAQWLKKAAVTLLKGHKADCIAILSTIEGVTPAEYTDSLDLTKLLTDVSDLISDSTFTTLFFSTAQSGNSSGSASESTEAPKA